jgi:nitrite reductase (NO-forming)
MSEGDPGPGPGAVEPDPGVASPEDTLPRGVRRRDLLLAGGLGGTLLLGGGALARGAGEGGIAGADRYPASRADAAHAHGGHGDDELEALGIVREGYGHGPAPPRALDADMARALATPPARDDAPPGTLRELELPVTVERHAVAEGAAIDAWVYAGRLPGPVIRATEGDRLRLHLDNRTDLAHNLHLHGAHNPQMDGWEPIPPGGAFTYELEARPAGLHPYHCHVPPLAEHVRRGLYGAMIVDPPGGREPAHEVVLVLGGIDLDGDGRNELYAFNGVCGLYDRHPIRVEAGELVRVHLVNMIEGDPVASFHLHAQTFDVIRSGIGTSPHEHTDQITLAQGDRAILEFRLPTRGRYTFHTHPHHMAERGALGWFTAV